MRVALESRRARGGLAVLAGAVPALTFPAPALWWLAPVALVPLLLLVRAAATGRAAALTGWLGGAGFMLAVHHWLLPSLHVFLVPLAVLLGALWAPWGWLVRRLLQGSPDGRRLAAAVLLVPAGWLMIELVRSWEYLGGPWGLFGASQWQVTPALRLVSVGGVWLVGFLLVAVNTAVTALIAAPAARRAAGVTLVTSAVVTGAAWAWAPVPDRDGDIRVAVVQPGGTANAAERFARSEALTRALDRDSPDLIVWGESSVGYDLGAHPELQRRLASLSAGTGAELLVNVDARRQDGPGIFKSSVLVGPDGLVGSRYDKMRLVPFGEYIPARQLLGWATSVGRAAGEDRHRGDEPVLMTSGGRGGPDSAGSTVFGPLICFETAFPDMSRHLVRDGARLLVGQTATATFQDSWAPEQHVSLAALRAAETGRPMVHATLTGVSAVYGPDGTPVGERLSTERSAAVTYTVPLASGSTLYVRYGDWVIGLSLAALAAYGSAEGVRALRARRAAAGGSSRHGPSDSGSGTGTGTGSGSGSGSGSGGQPGATLSRQRTAEKGTGPGHPARP